MQLATERSGQSVDLGADELNTRIVGGPLREVARGARHYGHAQGTGFTHHRRRAFCGGGVEQHLRPGDDGQGFWMASSPQSQQSVPPRQTDRTVTHHDTGQPCARTGLHRQGDALARQEPTHDGGVDGRKAGRQRAGNEPGEGARGDPVTSQEVLGQGSGEDAVKDVTLRGVDQLEPGAEQAPGERDPHGSREEDEEPKVAAVADDFQWPSEVCAEPTRGQQPMGADAVGTQTSEPLSDESTEAGHAQGAGGALFQARPGSGPSEGRARVEGMQDDAARHSYGRRRAEHVNDRVSGEPRNLFTHESARRIAGR